MKHPFQFGLVTAVLIAVARSGAAADTNAATETNVPVATPRAVTRSRGIAIPNADATPAETASTNATTNAAATPAAAAPAPDANITGTDLTSFDIISRRNIFNPNRSGRRVRTTRSERTAQVDSFTLVGTMSYEKGDFAIFDGTSSSYRKTLKRTDSIAGYKIADITTDYVKLSAASNQFITLPVGNQMRRLDGGLWKLNGRAETTPDIAASSSSSSSSSKSSGSSSAPAIDPSTRSSGRPPIPTSNEVQSEIMKRLMQKRESE